MPLKVRGKFAASNEVAVGTAVVGNKPQEAFIQDVECLQFALSCGTINTDGDLSIGQCF